MKSSTFAVGCVLITLVCSSKMARAQPSELEACVNAAEESQPLRKAGKLVSAREKLLVCTRPVCPVTVQQDCARWLADIERGIPSVVFRFTDGSGNDVPHVQVRVDDVVIAEKLDGRPITVDPGEHVFTYEAEGEKPLTEKIAIRQGEKARLVSVTFRRDKPKGDDTSQGGEPTKEGIPTLTWVLGGVGIGALGIGVALWSSGRSDYSRMKSTCATTHSCLSDDVDSAESKLVIGDVAVLGGLVAIGAGVVFAMLTRNQPSGAATLDVKMVSGGGLATLGGRF